MSLDAGQPEGELEKTRHSSDHGPAQPPGTVEYTVAEGETLTCIAAHFDVTPSQLKKINRLSVDFLYPGQILYIPVPSDDPVGSTIDPDVSSSQSDGVPEGEAKVKAQAPVVPPPAAALVYDLPSPPVGPLSPDDAVKLDEECFQRFIKIHAKYYTSADGVVGGTLLVTPNAVMFDPDVMDPLVASSGIEPYGVMAPMETVMSATIFSEISTRHELIGVRRYTSASHPSSSSSDEPQPELQPTEDGESAHSEAAADGLDLEESIDAKAFAEELTLEDSGDHRVPAKPTTTLGEASTSGDICENQEESAAAAAGIASGTSNGSTSADLCNDLVPNKKKQPSGSPLYFCMKVGQPINKKVNTTCPIEAYNQNEKRPHYWFSIPREKADSLYSFFSQWTPDIVDREDCDPAERGFKVIGDPSAQQPARDPAQHTQPMGVTTEVFKINPKAKLVKQMSKSWEIVSVEELRRRRLEHELEEKRSQPLPEMDRASAIFVDDHRRKLAEAMPARVEGHMWCRVFSSDEDGFSLLRLYRSMKDVDSPILLAVRDSEARIFGAVTSCAFKESEHFYGTGESFLYSFVDGFKVFGWTGENEFFCKGNRDSLAIGSGNGFFGLWIDGDMYHGRSQTCKTYDNMPLTGGPEDFVVSAVEAWAFLD